MFFCFDFCYVVWCASGMNLFVVLVLVVVLLFWSNIVIGVGGVLLS